MRRRAAPSSVRTARRTPPATAPPRRSPRVLPAAPYGRRAGGASGAARTARRPAIATPPSSQAAGPPSARSAGSRRGDGSGQTSRRRRAPRTTPGIRRRTHRRLPRARPAPRTRRASSRRARSETRGGCREKRRRPRPGTSVSRPRSCTRSRRTPVSGRRLRPRAARAARSSRRARPRSTVLARTGALDVHRVLDRRLVRPEELREGREQDLRVQPERPVLDVPRVLLEPLGPADLLAALHLRPAGYPGPHRQPPAVTGGIVRDLLDQVRPRPDEAHLALQNVDQLRQLVEARPPQEAAAARDPRIVGQEPPWIGEPEPLSRLDRVDHHRSELQHPERLADPAGALLSDQRRAAVVEPDPDHDRREDRAKKQKRQRGTEAVKDSLNRCHEAPHRAARAPRRRLPTSGLRRLAVRLLLIAPRLLDFATDCCKPPRARQRPRPERPCRRRTRAPARRAIPRR